MMFLRVFAAFVVEAWRQLDAAREGVLVYSSAMFLDAFKLVTRIVYEREARNAT